VLVLRALGLGDLLTGVPALRGLRRLHPGRPLVLAGPPGVGGWLRDLGVVDAVLPTAGLDGPPPGADLGPHDAVDLHGNGWPSHDLLLRASPRSLLALALPGETHGPQWRADEHEVDRWCRLVRSAGGDCGREDLLLDVALPPRSGHVVLHPGAASGSRRWPAGRWAQVARALADRGADVRLSGGADEVGLCAGIAAAAGLPDSASTAGTLGLPGLAELVGTAGLLVCGDTGVAHLATALGTPSVLLFGPVSPAAWGPAVDEHLHRVLWHGDGTGDPHGSEPDPALLRITADEVLDAVTQL
jgi:hypothetical protein